MAFILGNPVDTERDEAVSGSRPPVRPHDSIRPSLQNKECPLFDITPKKCDIYRQKGKYNLQSRATQC